MDEPDSSISTGTKETPLDVKSSEGSEVSVGHSKRDLSALYRWLEEKKWEYGIWISKSDRDHNKNCMGQIDPDGSAFRKLIETFGLTFSNQNGWETIIYKKDGLYFSWALNKNGYIRFWINDNLSWELFFRLLNKKLVNCNLTSREYKETIECLEGDEGKPFFHILTQEEYDEIQDAIESNDRGRLAQLETANIIGPADIIKRDFNKSCLIYKKTYFEGLLFPVVIKIDRSKGPWEIEFIGAEGPTRRLQDCTVRAFETVQSLGNLEFLQESVLQVSLGTNEMVKNVEDGMGVLQQQIIPKQDILSEFSELDGRLFNLDIKTDIQHIELQQHFKDLLRGVKNNSDNLGQTIILLDQGIQELKQEYKDVIFENTEPIITSLSSIHNNLSKAKTQLTYEIKNGVKEIKEDIKKVSDNLREVIKSNFKSYGKQLKNNLYLTLKKLNSLPGVTAKILSNELKVSQKTIYSYLKKLQDKKLIISKKKKSTGPGRPAKIFKSIIKNNRKRGDLKIGKI